MYILQGEREVHQLFDQEKLIQKRSYEYFCRKFSCQNIGNQNLQHPGIMHNHCCCNEFLIGGPDT